MKRRVCQALVRIYPQRWRREYGEEFVDVLSRRPLGFAGILNVVWNALGQQVRCGEPWLIVGIPWLLLHVSTIVWNILYPAAYVADSFSGGGWIALTIGLLLPSGIGFWTVMRNPQGHGGRAAMKNGLLISSPLCAVAILNAIGVLRLITLGPGDLATTFHEHGFAYTLYDFARRPTYWFPLFVMPFLQLPFAGAMGWVGGHVARAIRRRHLRA